MILVGVFAMRLWFLGVFASLPWSLLALKVFASARRATAHLFLAEPYPFTKKAFAFNQTRQKKTHRRPPCLGTCFFEKADAVSSSVITIPKQK